MAGAVAGGHLGDLVHHLHAAGHLAEYGIAEVAGAVVEKGVVLVVDKELAGGRVAHLGAGHGQGATQVAQAVVGFVLDRCFGLLLLHVGVEATALDHEVGDDPVELGVVVVAAVDVAEEILHADRGFLGFQLDFDLAQAGGHQHLGVFGGVQAAGQQQGTGGEGDCFQHGWVPC